MQLPGVKKKSELSLDQIQILDFMLLAVTNSDQILHSHQETL